MRNVLVTGGAGFIGSNLVDKLLANGDRVTVVDNFSTGKRENLPQLSWGSLPMEAYCKSDAANLRFVLTNCQNYHCFSDDQFDVIFHLAALARIQPSFDAPWQTMDSNVAGTYQILDQAKAYGTKVVYAGSSSFYFDPYVNPYSFSKWIGEECCKMYNQVYGTSVAIARFFNVYGPRQLSEGAYATVIGIFEKQRAEGRPLTVTGTGMKRRDFTHVEDIVEGLIAMSHDRWDAEIFNLGTGRNYSILDVANMFEPVGIEYLPNRPGEADVTKADISKTTQKLGWTPKHNLEDYILNAIGK